MSDQHPLVIRFGAFGDMVMITALLKRLYLRTGLACDVVGTGDWTRAMYRHLPWVRDVYTIKSRSAPYLFSGDKRRLARTLRQVQHEHVWLLETNSNSWTLAEKAGIDASINPVDLPRPPGEQTTEHWFRLANESPPGFDYPADSSMSCDTGLAVSEDELEECRRWLNENGIADGTPIVCIQPGNRKTMRLGRKDRDSNTKYWHEKRWAKVIDRVLEHDRDTQVILCGVPAEHAMTLDIHDLCLDRKRVLPAANELPMRRLFALLSLAHSCISIDTGPAHAAAALGCDVTVLYGKADARMCSPISTRCRVERVIGRIPGTQLLDTPESWAECHDISLVKPEAVYEGWLRSTSQS